MRHGDDVLASRPVQALLDCFFALLDMLLSIGGRGVVLAPTAIAALHQFSTVTIHRSQNRSRGVPYAPRKSVELIC